MTHKHDPIEQLDGLIKCRTCGELLPSMEETIAQVDSAVKVNRILQEIAVAGHYKALTFEDGFVVYARDKGNNREELAVKKLSKRNYQVLKRVVHVEP